MRRALSAGLLLSVFLAWPSLRDRLSWEKDRTVTLCVDGAELDALFPGGALPAALGRLAAARVRSVGLQADGAEPAEALAARWAQRLPEGVRLTLRPLFRKFSEGGGPSRAGDFVPVGGRALYFLPAGQALPSPGRDSPLEEAMASTEWFFPWVEFSRSPALEKLARRFPERAVRAHSIDEDELARLSPEAAARRFRRAVKERGARFLYVRFFPGLSPEANLAVVEKLAAALEADGFTPGLAAPRYLSARASAPWPAPLRQALAFLLAALGPWAAFAAWKDRGAWWARPFLWAASSLLAALLVGALLSSREFMTGLALFRGVKPALCLPLLLAGAAFYSGDDVRAFLRRPLTVASAALLSAAALAAVVYLLRSGHETPLGASGAELRLREALEGFFGVRPRFKEFAVGHPLLWLGAYAASRGKDARPLLLAGLIGPVSIVNTFCHAHVPLAVSLLRVFHGFWLGSLAGLSLIGAWRLFAAPAARPRRSRR